MKRQVSILLMLMIAFGGLAACTDVPLSGLDEDVEQDADASFARFFESALEQDGVAGVAAAVVTGDDTLFMEGFGLRDVEDNLPVTTDTLFHIGSTNKSMTALLIASLVDDGIVDWDTPVVEIYPAFALSDRAATANVSLRHLLSMQSGIPDFAEDDFDIDGSADSVIPYVASTDLLGGPGEQFSYSNISSSVAGYLGVIAATGSDQAVYDGYARLLDERIFQPIGMTDSVVRVSDALDNPNYGKSYVLDGGEPVEAEGEDFDNDPLAPSGSVKSSVRDMARYIQMQLNEGVAPNGERVVSAENTTETWMPNLESYGMGWENHLIDGVTVIMHEGLYDNYLSVIGLMPEEGVGFVVLSNTADASEDLIIDVTAMVIALYTE